MTYPAIPNQAKPDQFQQSNVAPGSPMAVLGLFVELVRRRFAEDQKLTWVWNKDYKQTKIVIESSFSEYVESRDARPAIWVDKDDSVIGATVVGDQMGQNIRTNVEGFWGLMTIPIIMECIASKRGESMVIGDIVQWYLHASSNLIQSKFGFHTMTPVVLQKTQPFERDVKMYVTTVTFTVQLPVRWSSTPIEPILRQVQLDIEKSGFDNATTYLEQIVLTSD